MESPRTPHSPACVTFTPERDQHVPENLRLRRGSLSATPRTPRTPEHPGNRIRTPRSARRARMVQLGIANAQEEAERAKSPTVKILNSQPGVHALARLFTNPCMEIPVKAAALDDQKLATLLSEPQDVEPLLCTVDLLLEQGRMAEAMILAEAIRDTTAALDHEDRKEAQEVILAILDMFGEEE